MLRRVFVACLVLLAVSPFSAPFQTCDLLPEHADEILLIDAVTTATSLAPDAGSGDGWRALRRCGKSTK
jgi:hypothetical protein